MASGTLMISKMKEKEIMRNLYQKGQNIRTLAKQAKLTQELKESKDHSFSQNLRELTNPNYKQFL